ncbi:hypothetical protein K7X08_004910 [Anisodus acutangulus]|uniref:Fe2OG dioxygenase domain-containing protein n=1 Tax=Anisodus acutangulus TaxID=402998 RepID=A0A9Q1MI38_9SOLA|nr:hypothetical protein K7X08_004910 [Anisodus acutangulus]
MTQYVPTSTILKSSVASVQIGLGYVSMDTNICVSLTTGFHLRGLVETYSSEVKKLSMRILELRGEGLGLKEGYFEELSKRQALVVNHYPPCPDPSLSMGVSSHCDPNLITFLQQQVYGLQILKDGHWIGVTPLPYAFVVNIGYQLQVY